MPAAFDAEPFIICYPFFDIKMMADLCPRLMEHTELLHAVEHVRIISRIGISGAFIVTGYLVACILIQIYELF